MTPGDYDLTIMQGADLDLVLTWKIDDAPVDIRKYTAKMQVRKTFGGTLLLDLSSETPDEDGDPPELWIEALTLGGEAGTITIHVDGADTAGLDWREARYDLDLVSDTDAITTLLHGRAILEREVTQ